MQSTSLVKYHTPILVSIANAKNKKQKKPQVYPNFNDFNNSILPNIGKLRWKDIQLKLKIFLIQSYLLGIKKL
jgi:hypothetical protein